MPGRGHGHGPLGPVPPELRIAGAIRAALEAVVPDPDRSRYFDRLNERFGDGTYDRQTGQVALVRTQPSIAAGADAVVASYLLPADEPRAIVVGWWHGIELAATSPSEAQLNTAWEAVQTTLEVDGRGIPGLTALQGQRTDPLRPGRLALRLSGGEEFAIRMAVDGAYAGPTVSANAHFWGWTT